MANWLQILWHFFSSNYMAIKFKKEKLKDIEISSIWVFSHCDLRDRWKEVMFYQISWTQTKKTLPYVLLAHSAGKIPTLLIHFKKKNKIKFTLKLVTKRLPVNHSGRLPEQELKGGLFKNSRDLNSDNHYKVGWLQVWKRGNILRWNSQPHSEDLIPLLE